MGKYTLVGVNGNAYAVMGYVVQALKDTGLGELKDEYMNDAMSDDYNHLLVVSMNYLDKANERSEEDDSDDEYDWEDEDE